MSNFVIVTFITFASLSSALAEGDASRGQQDFRACAPCHSLEPDRRARGDRQDDRTAMLIDEPLGSTGVT
jgi:cytochrome c2